MRDFSDEFDADATNNFAGYYYFLHYDIRGSVTSILKPDGTLEQGYSYDEFGNAELANSTSTFHNQMSFTGSISDSTTGLNYMNARYYNPAVGTFTSQDTYYGSAYMPSTQHLYSYTGANPINFIDPTGHGWWGDFTNWLYDRWVDSNPYSSTPELVPDPSASSGGSSTAWNTIDMTPKDLPPADCVSDPSTLGSPSTPWQPTYVPTMSAGISTMATTYQTILATTYLKVVPDSFWNYIPIVCMGIDVLSGVAENYLNDPNTPLDKYVSDAAIDILISGPSTAIAFSEANVVIKVLSTVTTTLGFDIPWINNNKTMKRMLKDEIYKTNKTYEIYMPNYVFNDYI